MWVASFPLILVTVRLLELGVHDVVVVPAHVALAALRPGGVRPPRWRRRPALRPLPSLLRVDGLPQRHHFLLQGLLRALDGLNVLTLQRGLELVQLALDLCLDVLRHLVRELVQLLLRLVHHRVSLVSDVHGLPLGLVVLRELLRLVHHPVHLVRAQSAGPGDLDVRLLVRALVQGLHAQDAVGVNVELDLDLRDPSRGGGDPVQPEVAQKLVVPHEFPLALVHVDLHAGLVVRGGREGLRLGGGQRGVPWDELGHHPAQGLQPEGEGGDVQQHDVADLSAQHSGLDRGAQRDHLIGVDGDVGLLAGEALDEGLDGGNSGAPAHQDDLVDLAQVQRGVPEGVLHGDAAPVQQVGAQLLELGPGQGVLDVLGAVRGGGDEGQRDGGLAQRGELHLGLLAGLGQPLQGLPVLPQVDALVLLKVVRQKVGDPLVKVVTAQVGVPGGGQDLEDPVADLEHRDVKGSAAQVEHEDGLVLLGLKAVREGSGGGLVDDPEHLQARDLPGVLGGLPLGVVEVRRHGDDGLVHLVVQELGRVLRELAQDLSGELLRGKLLAEGGAGELDVAVGVLLHDVRDLLQLLVHLGHLASYEPLDRKEGVIWVDDALPLGDLSHELVSRLCVSDDGRGCSLSLRVRHNGWLSSLHGRHSAVGGPEVNAHDLLAPRPHGSRAPRCTPLHPSARSHTPVMKVSPHENSLLGRKPCRLHRLRHHPYLVLEQQKKKKKRTTKTRYLATRKSLTLCLCLSLCLTRLR
mmetsp:Transcript_853/g.3331  ORF Transcript_853/g.3331 Transcript_853/m.3331 type:complete len:747 (-) Transcript_853:173-2413(-)